MLATSGAIGRARLWPLLLLLWLGHPLAPAAAADEQAAQVVGNWLTGDRDGIIEIGVASDGTYQGRIVGGHDPHRLDQLNPDESKRSQTLRGQTIIHGLKYDGQGRWSGGSIYDPDSGRIYKCKLELLAPDRLQVRGFIGFSLLGRSQVWTRYLSSEMNLPPASQH
jgi:uncharacterized protein (DUF2147 family)